MSSLRTKFSSARVCFEYVLSQKHSAAFKLFYCYMDTRMGGKKSLLVVEQNFLVQQYKPPSLVYVLEGVSYFPIKKTSFYFKT